MCEDCDDDTSEEDAYSSGYDSDSESDDDSTALLRDGVPLQPPRNEQPLHHREEPAPRRRKSKSKTELPHREIEEGPLPKDI